VQPPTGGGRDQEGPEAHPKESTMTSTAATLPTSTSTSLPTRRPSLRTAGIVAGATALVATAAVIGLTANGSATAQPAPHAHHLVSVARADAAESAHGAGATLSTGTGQVVRGTGFPAVRPDATELVHGGSGSLSDAAGRPVQTAP
jgi:hypothetical protein